MDIENGLVRYYSTYESMVYPTRTVDKCFFENAHLTIPLTNSD